jgi:cytochrome c553
MAADDAGARLATRGQWSKGVPACVQCHGPGGVGIGDHFPALAGQPAGYIASQLKAWQAGTRKNDPIELMRHVAAQLTDSDIQAVSNWFAAQPVVATGGRP